MYVCMGIKLEEWLDDWEMALLRKFFFRKPPDGLLEICDRVYGAFFYVSGLFFFFLSFFVFCLWKWWKWWESGELLMAKRRRFIFCVRVCVCLVFEFGFSELKALYGCWENVGIERIGLLNFPYLFSAYDLRGGGKRKAQILLPSSL